MLLRRFIFVTPRILIPRLTYGRFYQTRLEQSSYIKHVSKAVAESDIRKSIQLLKEFKEKDPKQYYHLHPDHVRNFVRLSLDACERRDVATSIFLANDLVKIWKSSSKTTMADRKLMKDSFSNILKCLVFAEKPKLVAQLYEALGEIPDWLQESMIVSLQKSGDVDKCLVLYKKMKKTLEKNDILNGLVLESLLKAFAVYHEDIVSEVLKLMRTKQVSPPERCDEALLHYLDTVKSRSMEPRKVSDALDKILSFGFRPTVELFNHTLQLLCKMECTMESTMEIPELVSSIYQKMQNLNVKMNIDTFSSLLKSCTLLKSITGYDMAKCYQYYSDMINLKIEPDQTFYTILIEILNRDEKQVRQIIEKCLNSFSKLETTLIATIVTAITQKPKTFSKALELVQDLRAKQGPLNIDVYNALLDAACNEKSSENIKTVLELIKRENIAPDQWTGSTLLKFRNISGIEDKTKKEISKIITRVLQECTPSSLTLEFITALITYFYERQAFKSIEKLYQMVKRNSKNYVFDKHYFDCIFRACGLSGNVKLGIDAFNEMIKSGVLMDRTTYILLMTIFVRNKDKLEGTALEEAIAVAGRVYDKAKEFHQVTPIDKEFQEFCGITK